MNYSLVDWEYEEGQKDLTTPEGYWYNYMQQGWTLIDGRCYTYGIDDEGNVEKREYQHDISSLDDVVAIASLKNIVDNFESYEFTDDGDGYYSSTNDFAMEDFAVLDNRTGLSASDYDAIALSLDGDKVKVVYKGLLKEDGGDDGDDDDEDYVYSEEEDGEGSEGDAEPTIDDYMSYEITDIGVTENKALKDFLDSYDGPSYASYLDDDVISKMSSQSVRADSTVAITDGEGISSIAVTSELGSLGASIKTYSGDSLTNFTCVTKGKVGLDNTGYINYINLSNELALANSGLSFLDNYSYGAFGILSSDYFGTNDGGKTYTLIDPSNEFNTLVSVILGSQYDNISKATLSVTDNNITKIEFTENGNKEGWSSLIKEGVINLSGFGSTEYEALQPYAHKSENDPLKNAIEEVKSKNFAIHITQTDDNAPENVTDVGKFIVDYSKNATMFDYRSDSDTEVVGNIIQDDKVIKYGVLNPDDSSYSVLNLNETGRESEFFDINTYLPSFAFSADLFTKSSSDESTYFFSAASIAGSVASTVDVFSGDADPEAEDNDGLSITLEDGHIKNLTYKHDMWGLYNEIVSLDFSEVGTASIPYDLSTIHEASNWDEEGFNNNLIIDTLKERFGDSYNQIPYIHPYSEWGDAKWDGYFDEDTYSMVLYATLAGDNGINDYINLLKSSGYVEEVGLPTDSAKLEALKARCDAFYAAAKNAHPGEVLMWNDPSFSASDIDGHLKSFYQYYLSVADLFDFNGAYSDTPTSFGLAGGFENNEFGDSSSSGRALLKAAIADLIRAHLGDLGTLSFEYTFYGNVDGSPKEESKNLKLAGMILPSEIKPFFYAGSGSETYSSSYKMIVSGSLYSSLSALVGSGIFSSAIAPMPKDKDGIRKLVNRSFKDPVDGYSFHLVNGVSSNISLIDSIISGARPALLYVGIALAIFSALLLATFVANSVSAKKREIGILRAVGARSSDVYAIFFNESEIIALFNSLIGIILTAVLCYVVNGVVIRSTGLQISLFNFSIRQVLLILGVAIVSAAVASFLPSFQISRKKPIDSINDR